MIKTGLSRIGLCLLTLALILVLAIGFQALQLRRTVPDYSKSITMSGLDAEVTIIRDKYAVPHIFAETLEDAAFGLGYVHAQDRMWQMEMNRRVAEGRLSEVLGKLTLPVDERMRTLGLGRVAHSNYEGLAPETKAMLEAYTNGVNAARAERPREMGPEFVLLNITPEPWTPEDSLAIFKLLSLGLSGNMFGEVSTLRLLQQLTPEQIAEFAPPYPGDAPVILPTLEDLYGDLAFEPLEEKEAMLETNDGPVEASNNWVIDGSRTISGKPLLSNDPHLSFTAPSIWYLAHIALPGRNFSGGTMAGIPTVLAGRTDDFSWGLTNTGPDTQDYYLERVNPDNPSEYQTPDGWAAFEGRTEEIKVRFGDPVTHKVLSTRHGPVIPSGQRGGRFFPEGYKLALKWTSLTKDDHSMDTQRRVMDATTWQEFDEAFRSTLTPMQNIVFAHRDGTIAFIAPAQVPIRSPENITRGRLPAPGWKAENEWQGFIPFEGLPRIENPESGMIATANNKTTPPGYEYFLTDRWSEPWRVWGIERRLQESEKKSVADFEAMHLDNVSVAAQRLLPFLLETPANREIELKVLKILEDWDGDLAPDGPQGLVYSVWAHNLSRVLYADELGPLYERYTKIRPLFLISVLEEGSTLRKWCDRIDTDEVETCDQILSKALAKTADQLVEDYGESFEREQWGTHHHVLHAHQPFSMMPLIGRFFEIDVTSGGGPFTPNQGMYSYRSSDPFRNRHGAGYRAVYDMNTKGGRFVQTTGQSGNPYSRHFDDMAPLWERGELIPLVTDPDTIWADAVSIARIAPEAP